MIQRTFLYGGLLFFMVVSAGCGQNIFEGMEDKESTSAKQYASLKSLDSGEFLTVLNSCFDTSGNLKPTANATDCSAAALGAAGLDPIDIARKLNDLIGGSTGDISAIGTLSIDPQYLDEIHKANAGLSRDCTTNNDRNACSQLVVTSIAEVVMAIAQVGETSGINVNDGISQTEAQQIAVVITGNPSVDTDGDGTEDTLVVDVIAGDALNIINNIDNSPLAGTDLGNVIQDQVSTIGGADCAPDSTNCVVTVPEIESYLNTQYGQ